MAKVWAEEEENLTPDASTTGKQHGKAAEQGARAAVLAALRDTGGDTRHSDSKHEGMAQPGGKGMVVVVSHASIGVEGWQAPGTWHMRTG